VILRSVRGTWLAAWIAIGLAAAGAAPAQVVHEDVAYAGEADAQRTLDLFLPGQGEPAPPLLAFVLGDFWRADDYRGAIGRWMARPLQRAGAAVALIDVRAAPGFQHPRQAEDVATALAFLHAHAGEYGYDPARIALAGRASGAQLASLVALDPQYLEAHELSPATLIGVASISGLYDLSPKDGFGSDELGALVAAAFAKPAARKDASPLTHVRGDAPLFLVTFAETDLPGAQKSGLAFAEALRRKGHPAAEAFGIPGRDQRTQLDLRDEKNPLRQHLLALLGLGSEIGSLRDTFAMRRYWRDPTLSSAGFWKDAKHVKTHDATPAFTRDLNLLFTGSGGPARLRPKRFQALDLFAWLERHAGSVGRGRWLVLTNARGEQVSWELAALKPYRPLLVIGVDGERELFRLVDFYHTERRTTWEQKDPETWVLARPVGAFLHFAEPAPAEIDPRAIGRFGLTPESLKRVDADPLAALATLSVGQRHLLVEEFHCVSCHSFRGAGGRASHLRARDAEQVGGYGLPLEQYPPAVWRRYCFEQQQVAKEIGATPVPLGDRARELFEIVERERTGAETLR
jgi:acetyl esterase/lipase